MGPGSGGAIGRALPGDCLTMRSTLSRPLENAHSRSESMARVKFSSINEGPRMRGTDDLSPASAANIFCTVSIVARSWPSTWKRIHPKTRSARSRSFAPSARGSRTTLTMNSSTMARTTNVSHSSTSKAYRERRPRASSIPRPEIVSVSCHSKLIDAHQQTMELKGARARPGQTARGPSVVGGRPRPGSATRARYVKSRARRARTAKVEARDSPFAVAAGRTRTHESAPTARHCFPRARLQSSVNQTSCS